MRRHLSITLAALCLGPAVIAATYGREPLLLQPESKLWIEGGSTVRDFKCSATAFQTRVESSLPNAVSAVLAGTKAIERAEFTIPAAKLDCRNAQMNEHMLKALKEKQNATIVFRITSYQMAKVAGGVDGTARGELTLGGVKKAITVTAQATSETGGVLRLKGSHTLRMTDYGIKPPSLMMGSMKVNEKVTIGFDLLLKGEAPKV